MKSLDMFDSVRKGLAGVREGSKNLADTRAQRQMMRMENVNNIGDSLRSLADSREKKRQFNKTMDQDQSQFDTKLEFEGAQNEYDRDLQKSMPSIEQNAELERVAKQYGYEEDSGLSVQEWVDRQDRENRLAMLEEVKWMTPEGATATSDGTSYTRRRAPDTSSGMSAGEWDAASAEAYEKAHEAALSRLDVSAMFDSNGDVDKDAAKEWFRENTDYTPSEVNAISDLTQQQLRRAIDYEIVNSEASMDAFETTMTDLLPNNVDPSVIQAEMNESRDRFTNSFMGNQLPNIDPEVDAVSAAAPPADTTGAASNESRSGGQFRPTGAIPQEGQPTGGLEPVEDDPPPGVEGFREKQMWRQLKAAQRAGQLTGKYRQVLEDIEQDGRIGNVFSRPGKAGDVNSWFRSLQTAAGRESNR